MKYIPLCNPVEGGCDVKWHAHPENQSGKVPKNNKWELLGKEERPPGNAGILVGRSEGIIAFDVDTEESEEIFHSWGLPETLTHKTGNGRHYIFKYPLRYVNPGTGEVLAVPRLPGRLEKILVRGSGSTEQIVAPGSTHLSRFKYYVELDSPVAELPDDFVSLMVTEQQEKKNFGPLNKLVQGERHNGLFSFASRMRYWDVPIDTAIVATVHFGLNHCDPPAPEENVIKIVEDAYKRYKPTVSQEEQNTANKLADKFSKKNRR